METLAITVAELRERLKAANGFGSVLFVKRKTGELRRINFYTGAEGNDGDNGGSVDAIRHNLLVVQDVQLRKAGIPSWRSIPLDTVKEIAVDGKRYTIQLETEK